MIAIPPRFSNKLNFRSFSEPEPKIASLMQYILHGGFPCNIKRAVVTDDSCCKVRKNSWPRWPGQPFLCPKHFLPKPNVARVEACELPQEAALSNTPKESSVHRGATTFFVRLSPITIGIPFFFKGPANYRLK